MQYAGRRITVMGLGHFGGGAAAARWLARQGAAVTVTDLADAATLAAPCAALADAALAAWHLDGHRAEDFRTAELIVVNPAVRPGHPLLERGRTAGVPLTTEIDLFLRACPARLLGVTGSNGKSTTAAMIAAILHRAGRRTWLGGNLGGSLLGQLEAMTPDDWVVLELSSFQLSYLGAETRVPEIAVVTGFSPNHLDWHRSLAEYAAAKQVLLARQAAGDRAVLNTFDPALAAWAGLARPAGAAGGHRYPAAAGRAGAAQSHRRRVCRGGRGGRRLPARGDRGRAGRFPGAAAADAALRHPRRPHLLQRLGRDHARIDRGRAGSARRADLAAGRRTRQGPRFHRAGRRDRPHGARGGPVRTRGRGAPAARGRAVSVVPVRRRGNHGAGPRLASGACGARRRDRALARLLEPRPVSEFPPRGERFAGARGPDHPLARNNTSPTRRRGSHVATPVRGGPAGRVGLVLMWPAASS